MAYNKWKLLWSNRAEDDLSKIEKEDALRIINKVETQLVHNPIELGKKLIGKYQNYFRYRVSDYRILYALDKNEIKILILKVGI